MEVSVTSAVSRSDLHLHLSTCSPYNTGNTLRVTSAQIWLPCCAQALLRTLGSASGVVWKRRSEVVSLACGFVFFRFAAAEVEFRQQSGRGRFIGHESAGVQLWANCRHTDSSARCSVVISQQGYWHDRKIQGWLVHVNWWVEAAQVLCFRQGRLHPGSRNYFGQRIPRSRSETSRIIFQFQFNICLRPRVIVLYKHGAMHRFLISNNYYCPLKNRKVVNTSLRYFLPVLGNYELYFAYTIPWWRVVEWRYSSTILYLDPKWKWMASSVPPCLYLMPSSRKVEIYLHSSIRLHHEVLNTLSTGTTLHFHPVEYMWPQFRTANLHHFVWRHIMSI
jgi:hypothetical protein